jgi:hypothetical protein
VQICSACRQAAAIDGIPVTVQEAGNCPGGELDEHGLETMGTDMDCYDNTLADTRSIVEQRTLRMERRVYSVWSDGEQQASWGLTVAQGTWCGSRCALCRQLYWSQTGT